MTFDISRGLVVKLWQGALWGYDGVGWTQLVTGAPSGVRAMTFDVARNRLVMITSTRQTWELVGSTFTQATPVASPAVAGMLAYDAHARVVVMDGGNSNADTWRYDGTTWTNLLLLPRRVLQGLLGGPAVLLRR
jgi:hypothetical protein